jgi:uncharacterized secreted protein with C-terminal beta-propeller domain
VVGSYDNLKRLLKQNWNDRRIYAVPKLAAAPEAMQRSGQDGSIEYSSTNVQVQGVDEADVIKTDGAYLYQATPDEVRIIRAYPAAEMKMVSRLSYAGKQFQPLELYVDEKRLVVIGHAGHDRFRYDPAVVGYQLESTVKVLVYDLRDKSNPRLVRELEMEGNYLSSRKIGSNLYLTANKYIDVYPILERDEEAPAPVYRDSAHGNGYQAIPYSDIRYFPEAVQPDYLLVGGINLDKPQQKLMVNAYLGAGENIYASSENLYVAVTSQKALTFREKVGMMIAPSLPSSVPADTEIYRFAMKDGAVTYTGRGSVPGKILNQFSMDEYKGHVRIATTSGDMWRTDEHTSKNNVYILNDRLAITGKLEGIAPGERIYSARFLGDRAYLVTFRKVDPLFVLDLKQPTAPRILGALKIPGYSDYLHPYDENHIIGFGKDTIAEKDTAYYQGMKVALFDVTNVAKPVEMFKTIIGDRGTDSELLRNHKALLFSKEKQLLSFPVTIMQHHQSPTGPKAGWEYGTFAFQGALVYRLDLQTGFTLRGRITHLSEEDKKQAGNGWYESDKNVERILYIGDTLYTVSKGYVQAHRLTTLRMVRSMPLK